MKIKLHNNDIDKSRISHAAGIATNENRQLNKIDFTGIDFLTLAQEK